MQWLVALLILVVVAVAGLQVAMLLKAKRQEGRAAPPLDEVLPEGIVPQSRMLFYFYSEHCGPCKAVTPLVDELKSRDAGVVKVDVRRHMGTARRFGVMGTPTLIRVDEGKIARVHVGGISTARLVRFYEG